MVNYKFPQNPPPPSLTYIFEISVISLLARSPSFLKIFYGTTDEIYNFVALPLSPDYKNVYFNVMKNICRKNGIL